MTEVRMEINLQNDLSLRRVIFTRLCVSNVYKLCSIEMSRQDVVYAGTRWWLTETFTHHGQGCGIDKELSG